MERQGDKINYLCLTSARSPHFSTNLISLLLSDWVTWDINREKV